MNDSNEILQIILLKIIKTNDKILPCKLLFCLTNDKFLFKDLLKYFIKSILSQ